MIKILFFIPSLSGGGAEKVLRNLVNNMDRTRFDITVQTIEENSAEKYLGSGINYKAINRSRTNFGKKLFSYWFRFLAELKLVYPFFIKDDYDIEIAYLETIPTKIIAQSTNKKALKLAWVHCDLTKKEGMVELIDKVRHQYKTYDKIVCVSKDVQRGFHELFGENFETTVLYNVIDEDEILKKAYEKLDWKSNQNEKKILAVGRLAEEKNFSYLIDVCKRLRDDAYRFQLVILGEGPERENLEQQIKKLYMEDYVQLKGFVENPYPWMVAADIIVSSSKYEGISTVIQEALILGKPVITTPCAGMRELLGDSEFGMIAENSEEGLYDSIRKMIDFPGIEEQYIQAALERGKDFVKDKIIQETEEFLMDTLKSKYLRRR